MNLGKVSVCLNENAVTYRGQRLQLTACEAELLYVLARHAPNTVHHDHLRAALWGVTERSRNEGRAVSVYVGRLRRKIKAIGLTVTLSKQIGYFLEAWEEGSILHPKASWDDETVRAFLDMCRTGMLREQIASNLKMTIRQVRSLHDFLRRQGRQPYPLPPKTVDLRRVPVRRQMAEARA